MAVRFDAASDRLLRTSDLFPSGEGDTFTVMFWVYWPVRPGNGVYYTFFASNVNDNANDMQVVGMRRSGGNDNIFTYIQNNESTGSTQLSAATWYHVAVVRSSNTVFTAYLDGSSEDTNTQTWSGAPDGTRQEFGAWTTGNVDPMSGRVAAIKTWSTNLSAGEVAQEMYTIRPIRTADLHQWHPCFPGATERLADYSGSGRDFTEGGTLTDEAPPPTSWGTSPITIPWVSAEAVRIPRHGFTLYQVPGIV